MVEVQQRAFAQVEAERGSLRVPGVSAPVSSLSEFEKVLRPRIVVPSQRYARFLTLDDEALAAAAVTTRHAAEHLRRVLEDLRGRSARVDVVLSSMASEFFSDDHGWRGLFDELRQIGSHFTEFKLLAIADYRRYLLNCLDALNRVSTDRLQSTLSLSQEEERTQLKMTPAAGDGFESAESVGEVFIRDLVRLPRGKTFPLREGRDVSFELWLGKRRFRVETWAGATLVDERGAELRLSEGRNLVGRGLYNDVIVDAEFTDISRRHLILDLTGGIPSAITDLSSRGTFLSRTLVHEDG